MDSLAKSRLLKAAASVTIAITVGTIGFWVIEGGTVPIGDCLYMTIITLSTVGYGEVIPMDGATRVFASFLIIFGMGSLIYFGSTVVALWVEADLTLARRRKRMQKAIDSLSDHIIICGAGTTGSHVVRELLSCNVPFVFIENDADRVEEVLENMGPDGRNAVHMQGDATEDRVLMQAGIERARGLIATLPNDKDNLFIVITGRQLNPDIRIISRATEKNVPPKMLRAGADRVVSPNLIGGMRIASEMIRPQVVEFLDMMLRDTNQNVRINQVQIPAGSVLVGKKLSDSNIRKSTDVLVIALRHVNAKYTFNPKPDAMIQEDDTLIVLGSVESVMRLREAIGGIPGSVDLINP